MASLPSMNVQQSLHQFIDSVEFVTPLSDKYICVCCNKGLWIPARQTFCGHRLCNKCVEVVVNNNYGTPKLCPGGEEDCVELTLENLYLDRGTDREIMNMDVYCIHKPKCGVIIKLRLLENHLLNVCEFYVISCPNAGNGCYTTFPRLDITKHLNEECEFALIICNYCQTQVARFDSEEHQSNCRVEEILCVYSNEGCQYRAKRYLMRDHVDSPEVQNHHLQLTTAALKDIRLENGDLEVKLNSMSHCTNDVGKQITLTANEIKAFKSHTQETHQNLVGTIEKYGSKTLSLSGISKALSDGSRDVQVLKRRIGVLEESQYFAEDSTSTGSTETVSRQQRESNERTVATHDVAISQNELRFRFIETGSHNGVLVWKITNYKHRKQMALQGKTVSLYSQPFYTHRHGYKMCARLYLGGDGMGKGTHASLYFVLMKGEYDNLLPWPFRQRITLMLMDQDSHRKHISDTFRPDPTSSSFRQPVSDSNIASGSPRFVQQTVIDHAPYCMDDTVFIMIRVDTSDLNTVPSC